MTEQLPPGDRFVIDDTCRCGHPDRYLDPNTGRISCGRRSKPCGYTSYEREE